MAYKKILNRVRKLEQRKLIRAVDGSFDRGAKQYRISEEGILSMMYSNYINSFIFHKKNHLVIKSLILKYFDEETVESFESTKDVNTIKQEYLHQCAELTKNTCLEI